MTNQQLAEQKRLEEILKLARMQLNEEYMKKHSAAHTTWLTSARTAWNSSGVLLPFSTKFVYPSEEEVVARGVEIYNTLTQKIAPIATAPVLVSESIDVVEEVKTETTTELIQAGGDFVIAEVTEDIPVVEEVPIVEEANDEVTDVEIKEETPTVTEPNAVEPTVTDSLLENKFKSLFTKWGGKGNY
jgi:hypothetical protein